MIPQQWVKNGGKSSVIGIIDTGLECRVDCFNNTEIEYKEFDVKNKKHGTHVASTIIQFSPKSKIIFAGGNLDSYKNLQEMLEWISNYPLDVLNLSLAFREDVSSIKNILTKIHSKGTIIVSAFSSMSYCPCKYDFVLKAGEGGEFNAPNKWVAYFHLGEKGIMKGSSVSSAITSGLCSLGRAVNHSMNKAEFLKIITPNDIFEKQNKKQVNVKL